MTAETSNARGEWVLVPRVPTEDMEHEGIGVAEWTGDVKVIWSAMLAAAPPPAAARGGVRGLVAKLVDAAYQDGMQELDAMSNETLSARSALEQALAAEGVQAGEVEQQPEARGGVDGWTLASEALPEPGTKIDFAVIVSDGFVKRGVKSHPYVDAMMGRSYTADRMLAWRPATEGERNG